MTAPYDDDRLTFYLREIGAIQPLTKVEETDLLRHVRDDDAEKELSAKRLIEANLHLVVSIAGRYSSSGVPMLELIVEGNRGLLTAIATFAESGDTFDAHAASCIESAISKAIAEST